MRQRKVLHEEEVGPRQPVLRRVAKADLFPKPKEDYQREQTAAGAIVSTVTVAVICLLVLWEGLGYAVGWGSYDTDLSIDNNTNRSMDVNIDITFPYNPCDRLSIDIRDVSGSRRINITRSLQKIPLTPQGRSAYQGPIIGVGDEDEMENWVNGEESCGSCFLEKDENAVTNKLDDEGKLLTTRCCERCDEVLAAYRDAGLTLPEREAIPQCLSEIARAYPGCRVVGVLHLKKIPGTLVFAPRQIQQVYHMDELFRFRSDHKINRLVIGNPRVKRFSANQVATQLDDHMYTTHKFLTEVRYFMSIVPTTYNTRKRQPDNIRTYEYAVQWQARNLLLGYNGIPAVTFRFDFSPIQIDNYFARPPLTQFLIKLCGIVGGLFVVLGVVDRIVGRVMLWRK